MQVFREPCHRALFLLEMPQCALGLKLKGLDVNRDLHRFELCCGAFYNKVPL